MTTRAPNLAPPRRRSDEWGTPASVLAPVHRLLGRIDLDPASSAAGNQLVGARRYFTREDDGLSLGWEGATFWCNPPFSQKKAFLEKLHDHYVRGYIREAVFLLPAMTETRLWQEICSRYWWCAWKGRISFLQPEGKKGPCTFPTALIYFGERITHFRDCLGPHGLIYGPALNLDAGHDAWKERLIA